MLDSWHVISELTISAPSSHFCFTRREVSCAVLALEQHVTLSKFSCAPPDETPSDHASMSFTKQSRARMKSAVITVWLSAVQDAALQTCPSNWYKEATVALVEMLDVFSWPLKPEGAP